MRLKLLLIIFLSTFGSVLPEKSVAGEAHLPFKIYQHSQFCKQLPSGAFYQCESQVSLVPSVFEGKFLTQENFLGSVPIKVLLDIENACMANGPVNLQFSNDDGASSETRIGAGQSARIETVFSGAVVGYQLKIRYGSATQIFPDCNLQVTSILETKDLALVRERIRSLKDLGRTLASFSDQLSSVQSNPELLAALEMGLEAFNAQLFELDLAINALTSVDFQSQTKRAELLAKKERIEAAAKEFLRQKDTLSHCENPTGVCEQVNLKMLQFIDEQIQQMHAELFEIKNFLHSEVLRISTQNTELQNQINELLILIDQGAA